MAPIRIIGPDEAQLLAAAQLHGTERAALLGHLRWHQRTPYALVRVALHGRTVVGCCTALRFASSARVATLIVHPDHRSQGIGRALLRHVMEKLEAEGVVTTYAQTAPERIGFWEGEGFSVEERFLRFAGGLFIDAVRDEVLLLEPAHTLALLHLDQRATGDERRQLLLEHRYAAHGYVDNGRLRGGLLPVLGHGLIIADATEVGLELQRWLLPSQTHIIVPEANTAACAHLQERKYHVESTSVRMVRGTPLLFRPELVFAWPW